jgi:hypothetical protein
LQVIKPGLVKGPWKPEEDAIILKCLADGITKWSEIAERIAGRIGKQCRERYFNHLDRECVAGGREVRTPLELSAVSPWLKLVADVPFLSAGLW